MVQHRILATLVAGLAAGVCASAAATEYSIEDIGPVSSVTAINNHGEVLARDVNGAFVYRCGHADYLPQVPGASFVPQALNDFGEVVGYSANFGLAIYRKGEVKIVEGVSGVSPSQVNNRGQIAGDLVREYRAFLYSHHTVIGFGSVVSAVRDMNEKGEVVGVTDDSTNTRRGFLYRHGQYQTFLVPDAASTEADAINERGAIAGIWAKPETPGYSRIFKYKRGRFHDLGQAFGQAVEQDTVAGMNRFGVIVGSGRASTIPNGGFSAYAYFPRHGFVELNTLIPPSAGWFLQITAGINDRGQIAGTGLFAGVLHGFILTPMEGSEEE
jgi:hypothetical protein